MEVLPLSRILIVDDHIVVGEGTKAILERKGSYETTFIPDSHEVMDILKQDPAFDLVLLDLQMPGINGLELSREILNYDPDMKIVVYTGLEITDHFNLLLEAGVTGFISKTATTDQLILAIEAALDNHVYLPVTVMRKFRIIEKDRQSANGKNNDHDTRISLNAREQEIMHYVSAGLTNKEIGEKLYISQRAVEYSLTSIFSKLKVKSRTEALMKVNKHQISNKQS
ncbi:DNA-binding response regulator [Alteribacter lacisalsi]|uniref:DNA-binding response regulator n=1 Tax=Alteribacter lacisalsi TaxID=2045244 RepID=A0A2W0HNT0_9BACI|nr:DNA-binding response regulator [Alteribacter lacisalsi]